MGGTKKETQLLFFTNNIILKMLLTVHFECLEQELPRLNRLVDQ